MDEIVSAWAGGPADEDQFSLRSRVRIQNQNAHEHKITQRFGAMNNVAMNNVAMNNVAMN